MAAHTFINGFGGSVTFASFTLDVESWSLSVDAEILETTNTGDAGWASNIVGAKSWEGSCKTYWDSAAVPTGAAGLIPGGSGTITLNVGTSGKTYGGSVRISQVKIENPTKGVVPFELSFKGNGAITYAS